MDVVAPVPARCTGTPVPTAARVAVPALDALFE
jgi:hypothetical protein